VRTRDNLALGFWGALAFRASMSSANQWIIIITAGWCLACLFCYISGVGITVLSIFPLSPCGGSLLFPFSLWFALRNISIYLGYPPLRDGREERIMGNEAEVDVEKQQWDDEIVSPTDVHDSEKSQVSCAPSHTHALHNTYHGNALC
jgi:hypothetical protein